MATAELLAGLVRSAFGAGARLRHVSRLRGATKKGVYRVVPQLRETHRRKS